MSLSYYKLIVLLDKDGGGQNSAINQDVLIKDSSGNLALIYADKDGLMPISQPGAKTDNFGGLEFYAEIGDYFAESGGSDVIFSIFKPEDLDIFTYNAIDLNEDPIFLSSSALDQSNFGIIHTGQSLAAGGVGGDFVEGVFEPKNGSRAFMLSPNPCPRREATSTDNIVGLYEQNWGEDDLKVTIATSMTDWIIQRAETPRESWFFSGQAWGAKTYNELKKGGSTGVYEKVIDQVVEVDSQVSDIEYKFMTCIHGESDGEANNTGYAADLLEWINDFNSDVKAVTGQSINLRMLLCQTATAGGYGFNGGINELTFPTPLEQLEAHENNSNITMVCSKYHLPYADKSHITNLGQRTLGEYYGKMAKKVINAQTSEPLRPTGINQVSATEIEVDFTGNTGSLAFDTTLVSAATNQGFSYTDGSGGSISSVAITGTNQVTVTIDATIGASPILAYAYHNGAGGESNQVAGLGDRGNLRDSDPARSGFDSSIRLYNWCVIFRKAVTTL